MRKGIAFIGTLIILVVVLILLTVSYNRYSLWKKRVSIENDVYLIYSIINEERMRVISEGKSLKVIAKGENLIVENISSGTTRVLHLNNPFSGIIYIYPKGIMSRGAIVYLGDLSVNSNVSCVSSNSLQIRVGQTYVDSDGSRKCR